MEKIFRSLSPAKFIVVYGEKNTGKTIFLLQLAKFFLERNFFVVYLAGSKQLKKVHEGSFWNSLNRIKSFLGFIIDNVDSKVLNEDLITNLVSNNNKFVLIIDTPYEILRMNILELSRVLFSFKVLSKLLQEAIFVLSIFENIREGLPYMFSFLVKYRVDMYIRIERVSRLRLIACYKYDYNKEILMKLISEEALLTKHGFKGVAFSEITD